MLLTNAVNTEGRPLEIYVKDGKIAAVGQDLSALAAENETVVDAGGLTVLPAFVDLHCHWRTPGFEYKEDIETGSRAAAAGGYTFVNLMPNTKPVCSSAAQAVMVEQKAAEVGLCDANQTVSITENFDGVSIDHLKTLPASVKFITEDGHGVQDNATMARAFAICTQKDITVMSHAEDMEISPWDYRLAEDIETVRNCWLSEYYQTRLHMCHVSTRGALDAIRMAKLRGAPVTCEVTPHHLWFTNDTCDYRVNPPIRTADDVEALVEGIRTGIVDAIATDHAPHSEEDKLKGMAGMVGRNMWTFIMLDTYTGKNWQVQFSVKGEDYMFAAPINIFSLAYPETTSNWSNRFQMFRTQNMWTFILLDSYNGRLWQVQYSTQDLDNLFCIPINKYELVSDNEKCIFSIQPLTSMYQYYLINDNTGDMWKFQWSTKGDDYRWIEKFK